MNIACPEHKMCLRSKPGDHSRTRGRNIEEDFFLHVKGSALPCSRTYIGIQWWHQAVQDSIRKDVRSFSRVAEVQQFVDALDRGGEYFAVSRGDDGIYETLPPDTVVFSSGGTGDIAIPLLPPNPEALLRIVDVPPELQTPRLFSGPNRGYGWSIEEHFSRWVMDRAEALRSPAAYMPVHWWNNTAAIQMHTRCEPFAVVKPVQDFVDEGVSKGFPAFTVSRGADGIYEKLPAGLVVFSAGGEGDVPIPHLSEIDPGQPNSKNLLASFVGAIECGGPESPKPTGRSSWNPDGAGATIRRKMREVFAGEADCIVREQSIGGNWNANDRVKHEDFRKIAERSWFGLAPRGYGRTSYRLYEMFVLGAIPVYIYDDPWLPYLDRLDWTEFAVLCHANELPSLPSRLRAVPISTRLQMLQRGRDLTAEWFTPEGVCRKIMEYASRL